MRRRRSTHLDADALNLLALQPFYSDSWILTPHVGEAARLLQTSCQAVQDDIIGAAKAIQKKYGGICVLKSARTVVVSEGAIPAVCPYGNPGMATAGMGDILSGVLGGLLAQKLSLVQVACLGVLVHALAGDAAVRDDGGERGLVALDLVTHLRKLVN